MKSKYICIMEIADKIRCLFNLEVPTVAEYLKETGTEFKDIELDEFRNWAAKKYGVSV